MNFNILMNSISNNKGINDNFSALRDYSTKKIIYKLSYKILSKKNLFNFLNINFVNKSYGRVMQYLLKFYQKKHPTTKNINYLIK